MGAGVMKKSGGGGRRGRRRGSSAAMSEINVTPFVDVMLVLLIIFMVAAPMLTVGVPDAELIPKLSAIAKERTSDKVFLRADGALAYERVAQVMGALNKGGFNNIGLVTDAGGPAMDGEN